MKKSVLNLTRKKAHCGLCKGTRTIAELRKGALKKKIDRELNIEVIAWKCKNGHTNFTAFPLDKSKKM